MNFAQRSTQTELLDEVDIPFTAIKKNMQELNFINKYLGGHAITITAVQQLLHRWNGKPVRICEIGCGGGDNLQAIAAWCVQKNIPVTFIGIDINPHCIAYAQSRQKNGAYQWICSDYKTVLFDEKPDVIFSSLFCHHFTDAALTGMLQWMYRNATIGFFINDLHRHPVAYHAIKLLTTAFSRSFLVKNDAPLSVLRGFKKREWELLLQGAGIDTYHLQWKWAFRWLIIAKRK